jgi:hypothetical protein
MDINKKQEITEVAPLSDDSDTARQQCHKKKTNFQDLAVYSKADPEQASPVQPVIGPTASRRTWASPHTSHPFHSSRLPEPL